MYDGILNRKVEDEYSKKRRDLYECHTRKVSPEELQKILNERGKDMGKSGPKPGFKKDKRVNELELADQQTIKGAKEEPKAESKSEFEWFGGKKPEPKASKDEKYKYPVFEAFKSDTEATKQILKLEREGYFKRITKGFDLFEFVKINQDVQKQVKALEDHGHIKMIPDNEVDGLIKKYKEDAKKIKPEPKVEEQNDDATKAPDAEDKEISNALKEVFPAPAKKPPLGIMPKRLHDEQRLESLKGAIERYVGEKCQVPLEWIVEYNQLVKEVK